MNYWKKYDGFKKYFYINAFASYKIFDMTFIFYLEAHISVTYV